MFVFLNFDLYFNVLFFYFTDVIKCSSSDDGVQCNSEYTALKKKHDFYCIYSAAFCDKTSVAAGQIH